jgi:alginate O-acetyltransferase complex protein AlgI
MLFNSMVFLLVFLPIVFFAYGTFPNSLKIPILLVSSLVFYGFSGIEPLIAMLLSVFWVHWITLLYHQSNARFGKLLVVTVPLLLLVLFRYLDFILDSTSAPPDIRDEFSFFLDIMVPAGISFYTFQIIAYGIDVLEGTVPREPKFYRLMTFVSFFPQLIAGPIVRYKQLKDQLIAIEDGTLPSPRFADGFRLIAVGLVYKMFFADGLHLLHSQSAGNPLDMMFLDRWISVFIYSFQIFYDFYGYSLMALGLGLVLGIRLPQNFLRPYLSRSPREFWRRWHVTLSIWLRDYVYFRMGGARRYFLNIMVLFLAVGLWHGADWSFIVWGGYHALLMISYTAVRGGWDRMPGPVQVFLTYFLVSMGWPLFYLDLPQYLELMVSLLTFSNGTAAIYQWHEIAFVSLVAAWTFSPALDRNPVKQVLYRISGFPFVQALCVSAAIMMFHLSTPFIYFRF